MAATKKKTRKQRASKTGAAGGKQPNPGFEFLMNYMQKNPSAVFADARDAGAKAGHKIYPITWGRAQLLLGRVKAGGGRRKKVAKRGPGRPPGSRGPGRPPMRGPGRPPKRGPGRPRSTAPADGVVIDDPTAWQALIEQVNAGARLSLSYDGNQWTLAVA